MEDQLSRVSFLVGEWRGSGTLDFPGPPVRRSNYDIRSMCKFSPDKTQLLMVTFNDDPKTDSMFHATQSFIYVDRESRQLRARRSWFMDTDNEGFVTIERLSERDQADALGFTVVAREGVPEDFRHDGTIERVGESEMVVRGEVRVNNKSYPYIDVYKRRNRP